MKLTFSFLLALCFTFVAADGGSNFIVGGEDAHVADYPYMAGVLNFGLPSCGGSIITARSVLTVKNRRKFCCITADRFFLGRSLLHH
jgi:secreted trypsin-like serine protease